MSTAPRVKQSNKQSCACNCTIVHLWANYDDQNRGGPVYGMRARVSLSMTRLILCEGCSISVSMSVCDGVGEGESLGVPDGVDNSASEGVGVGVRT